MRSWFVFSLLLGCAPAGSSSSWTLETNYGTSTHDATASIRTDATGERLTISYSTTGDPGVVDDEVSAWIYVDLTELPAEPRAVTIAGRVGYDFGGSSGVAQPPMESRWTFTPSEGNDPTVRRVLVYWGVYRDATSSYAGDVTGTLTIEAVSAGEVRGTLHLEVGSDAPGQGGTPFFFGPTTSDVAFVAPR